MIETWVMGIYNTDIRALVPNICQVNYISIYHKNFNIFEYSATKKNEKAFDSFLQCVSINDKLTQYYIIITLKTHSFKSFHKRFYLK